MDDGGDESGLGCPERLVGIIRNDCFEQILGYILYLQQCLCNLIVIEYILEYFYQYELSFLKRQQQQFRIPLAKLFKTVG